MRITWLRVLHTPSAPSRNADSLGLQLDQLVYSAAGDTSALEIRGRVQGHTNFVVKPRPLTSSLWRLPPAQSAFHSIQWLFSHN